MCRCRCRCMCRCRCRCRCRCSCRCRCRCRCTGLLEPCVQPCMPHHIQYTSHAHGSHGTLYLADTMPCTTHTFDTPTAYPDWRMYMPSYPSPHIPQLHREPYGSSPCFITAGANHLHIDELITSYIPATCIPSIHPCTHLKSCVAL